MKLVIQIPCLNERDQLPATVASLPRCLRGIDSIELLVVDDGSTDGTAEMACRLGVDHVIRFRQHRGLSAAFTVGLREALRIGADIIVNTDADNQYCGDDIAALLEPILTGQADVVVGDRGVATLLQFSSLKRLLQRFGTHVVGKLAQVDVKDATSGFRAMTKEAAAVLFIHNRFSYTIETIMQLGVMGFAVQNVPIRTNPATRKSRLFRSTMEYLLQNGPVVLRSFFMYRPVQTLGVVGMALFLLGLILIGRFALLYAIAPNYSGHVQSLVVGVGSMILSFIVSIMMLLSELIAANRRMIEEVLVNVRRIDAALAAPVESRRALITESESDINPCLDLISVTCRSKARTE